MNKKIFTISMLLVSGILLILTVIFNSSYIFSNPFSSRLITEYPSFSSGNAGTLYVIDQSLRRIIRSDLNGKIKYVIMGGSRDEQSFYNATELAADKNENIYVINKELDSDGFYMIKESIIQYNSDAEPLKTIFTKKYDSDYKISQLVQRGQLSGIQYRDNSISWFDIAPDGIFRYIFDISADTVNSEKIADYKDANIFVSSVICYENDRYAYVTKQGEIFSLEKGQSVKIYSAAGLNSTPWKIKSDRNSNIYFSDLYDGSIKKIDSDGSIKTVFSSAILEGLNFKTANNIFYSFFITEDNSIIVPDESQIIMLNGNNASVKSFLSFKIPDTEIILKLIKQFIFAFLALSFVILLLYYYIRIMNKKLSLIIKQIVIFVPITVFALLFTSKMIFDNMSDRYQNEITERLSLMVQIIPQSLDGDLFKEIRTSEDFMNDSYQTIRKNLHEALNDNRDSWNLGYYFALHHVVNGRIYSLMWLNDDITPFHPFSYLNDPEGIYVQALTGEIMTEKAIDAWGLWMDAVGPIYDSQGNVTALLEIGKDYTNYAQENERLFLRLLLNVCIISLLFIIIFTAVTFIMLTKIRSLRNGAKLIAAGNWDIRIKPHSNDEVTELTESFNEMAQSISTYVTEIIDLNKAYYRFVPEQFLKFLNKQSVKEVMLGDQMQLEMSIMFTDIRNFTEMSEKMTPKENFDFLNHYLGLVGPVVRDNEGFVDKYIGDAIMALFPVRADDAVETAIGISAKVHDFNIERENTGKDPISIGFGIHTGLLTLGILGETERVDSTVISDNVNLASRLEGLTKKFGASIIISEVTLKLLEFPDSYQTRYLGKIQVKGKGEAVNIYEILNGLGEKEKRIKTETTAYLETAIDLLMKLEITKAKKNLITAYKMDKTDKAIVFYYKLCLSMEKYPDRYTAGSILMTEK
ncbi:MAG: HAMP domain-containing protein [Spirochaetes bacterium]|nr:HAMP domain-containing protein [Spirochaetota bacterium]